MTYVTVAHLNFFQRLSRYGSHDIMRTFDLSNPIPDPRAMMDFQKWDEQQPIPDIVIAATCESRRPGSNEAASSQRVKPGLCHVSSSTASSPSSRAGCPRRANPSPR